MLTGLIGYPLNKTLSPMMHQAAYRHLGIEGHYVCLAVERNALKTTVQDLAGDGYQGVNITTPYKQTVIRYLDSISRTATKVNAVNTVMIRKERLIGENTDVIGFERSLTYHRIHVQDRRVLVIGAGGAGRAVGSVVTKLRPACVYVTDVVGAQLRNFVTRVQAEVIQFHDTQKLKGRCDIVINASPVDQQRLASIILHSEGIYYDLNYRYPTALSAGIRVINGLEMLVQQGARSFELWTGIKAPVSIMRKAVKVSV